MQPPPAPAPATRRAGSRRAPRRPSRLRRRLTAAVRSPWTALLCATAAGVSAGVLTGEVLAKEIRLAVDGGETTILSFGGTVGEVLGGLKIRIGPHDRVEPAPGHEVRDGTSILVRHARPLVLTVDGRRSKHTVTALNVGEVLEQLDLDGRPATLSASRMRQIPVSGFALSVRTQRRVTVVRGGVRLDTITTGRTVRAVLAQHKITLAKGERVRPPLGTFPEDSQVIRIIPAPPPPPVRASPVNPSVTALNWTALARCETYANPKSFNPRGPYYGMYQFSLPMWRAVGGTRTPLDWPAGEQTYRAQLLYQRVAGRWHGQWPNCGARLFNR
ncbi:ubiquitin-like domain-containing protein [Sphaerisporangium sp. NPDC051011]|uniref:ubiquitin-like domain-containing protein n=1 Tax=Sphaerisporangium sp. NPDC051011 TaxID=3155792 RepID=UPI0033FE1A61